MNKKTGIFFVIIILFLNSSIPNSFFIKKTENAILDSTSLASYFQDNNNDVDLPEVFRIADVSRYDSFDPHSGFFLEVMSLPYDALVDFNLITGEIVPSLATQWVVTNDSKEWTFTLRENVTFHDDTQLNSLHVKYSLERFFYPTHPEFVSHPYWDEIRNLPFDSIEIIDNLKFKITLSESYSPFLTRLALIKIITPNSFESSVFNVPIGTGPYKIDLATSNNNIINFTRFEDHFRGLAPFKFIDYQTYVDRFEELEEVVDSENVDLVMDRGPISNYFHENDFLGFNTVWNISFIDNSVSHDIGWFNYSLDVFADAKVRQALNYALNKQDYVDDVKNGLATPKNNILTKNLPYYDDQILGYPYNLEIAKNLLDEAGYSIEIDGYRFEIDVVSPSFSQARAQFVCDSFELIGIKCNQVEDHNDASRLFSGDFDFYVVGMIHSPDIGLVYDLTHTNGTLNFGSFSDTTIDILTSLALETPVKQEQDFYYKLLQTLFQEEAPYLLLSDGVIPYSVKKEFSNVVGLNKYTLIGFHTFFGPDPNQINSVNAVEVINQAVYAETTDVLITNPNSIPLTFNIEMTNNQSDFISSGNNLGKFIKLNVDKQEIPYYLRVYYDPQEIEQENRTLTISQYNEETNSWIELILRAEDQDLRYLEVEINGDVIVQLLQKIVTYTLVPFVLIFTILMTIIIIVTVVKNQKIASYTRKTIK
ncbi:MAG: ABC transporter substrate-binding protein [Candidatus Hodarchaeales archaeon]|jgi:peptide/nickel transport system substrate-binding protein